MRTFSLFGYDITIQTKNPSKKVYEILEKAEKKHKGITKIQLIKLVRLREVSRILIDAGLVPDEELRKDGNDLYVSLPYAKEWVEQNYLNVKR